MIDDWRTIHRHPDQPDIKVGDLITGMEGDADGRWWSIVAAVEAVELAERGTDGSRVYRVLFGPSVRIETPE